MEIHRQIRFRPIAGHPQPLELLALDVHPLLGKAPALAPELIDRHVVLVLALLAVLFFDLPLDGQTVTVPTGDIARIKPHHLVRAHDDVLDGLVERMANVQVPIGIGRAIMQRERLAPLFVAQLVINPDLFPLRQPGWLALGQACAHGEVGFRQVQGVFIFVGRGRLGAHRACPSDSRSNVREGRCERLKHLCPASHQVRAPGK